MGSPPTPPSSPTGPQPPAQEPRRGPWTFLRAAETVIAVTAGLATIAGFLLQIPPALLVALWALAFLMLLAWIVLDLVKAGQKRAVAGVLALAVWAAAGMVVLVGREDMEAMLAGPSEDPGRGAPASEAPTEPEEPGEPGEPSEEPTEPGEPQVYHQTGSTPLSVKCRSSFDLDTPPEDPTWRVGEHGGGKDLSYCADSFSRNLYVPMTVDGTLTAVDHGADYEACAGSTVFDNTMEAARGARACVRTDERRWAFVEIVAVDHERDSIDVEIVVWDRA